MDALGYQLTWPTKCFLGGGCGKSVFAHTNGSGDFVLFDRLGWPWDVHQCYYDRFNIHVGRSRKVAYNGPALGKWSHVIAITPNAHGLHPRHGFIGTVTNLEKGLLNRERDRAQGVAAMEQIRKVLKGRTSVITIVTGEGAEYTAFFDFKANRLKLRDTVVCDVNAVELLNQSVFVVTRMRVIEE